MVASYKPRKGKDGASGEGGSASGKDGISITNASINSSGELVIYLSEGEPINVGKVVGKDGAKGESCTHSWNGTTLTVTSASGSSSADLKGDDGVPCTHSWDGTTLTVTSASGTSSADLQGIMGAPGNGITSMQTLYATGTSATSAPTTGWDQKIPSTLSQGKYLWTRTVIHTRESTVGTTHDSVSYLGIDGEDGTGSVNESSLLQKVYPVGSIYMSMNSTNPGTLFGGTWKKLDGKFLLGASTSAGLTGGAATVTLTEANMPAHTHDKGTYNITGQFQVRPYTGDGVNASAYGTGSNAFSSASGSGETWARSLMGESNSKKTDVITLNASDSWTGSSGSAGAGTPHSNMPPYITVYMWQRTA